MALEAAFARRVALILLRRSLKNLRAQRGDLRASYRLLNAGRD